uniref:3'(2'),5'-bisphosphate nucleotidase 1 n=1 Tax=Phallusia mammillata TaxID=59560 RepID=A0A6F9D7Y2_9ASCI|nr:3'(2'),5'-bisphosphate nucleotidase 1-like [Phallusia mammillata]
MASGPVIHRVLAASVRIADKAAELVRQIMTSGDLGIVDKGGQKNLQTKADRSVEKLIRASLISKFPKLVIIGEEDEGLDPSADAKVDLDPEVMKMECPANYSTVNEENIVVWVDPLDGTAEFTEGLLDHVTILIGLAVNGKAVGGVVNQPFYNYQSGSQSQLGRSIWGLMGLGAFGWNRAEPPTGRRILITTRSHSNKLVNLCLESMSPTAVERQGGAGNKVIRVIEGEADAYVFASPGCKKWDTCAPEAILCAIGGQLTDVHGKKIQYDADVKWPNLGGVIATYREHNTIINLVPQEVKDALQG